MHGLQMECRPRGPDVVVLELHGEASVSTGRTLSGFLEEVIDQGYRQLLIDMAEVTYLDSSALGALVGSYKKLTERGGTLLLVSPSPLVQRVLQISRLDRLFNVCDTEQQALSNLREAVLA